MGNRTFTVDSTRHRDGWVLALKGELDIATVPCVQEVIDSWSIVPDHLIVDTSEVSFMDSSGLGILFRIRELVNGRISLRRPSEQTIRLLEVSGFGHMFDIENLQPS